MNGLTDSNKSDFRLPVSVLSHIDVLKLINELEQVENDYITARVQERAGFVTELQPSLTETLADLLMTNHLQIENDHHRQEAARQLRALKDSAPVVHLTFASAVDKNSLQEVVGWLRQSVHPQVVVSVGLQPDLIGGVYIRTPNKVHDLSVRAQLAGHRGLITEKLEALRGHS